MILQRLASPFTKYINNRSHFATATRNLLQQLGCRREDGGTHQQ